MNVWRDPTPTEPLALTPADVVALVAHQLEVTGRRPALTPLSLVLAEIAAAELLALIKDGA